MKINNSRFFSRGFTLVELMVTVAIVAILASIAYPSYQNHIIKTRRATAAGCLLELGQWMERYYTTNLTYATANIPNTSCQTDLTGVYTFALSAKTATTYQLDAAPAGPQVNDTGCGSLSLNHQGTKSASGANGQACWR